MDLELLTPEAWLAEQKDSLALPFASEISGLQFRLFMRSESLILHYYKME